LKKRIVFLRFKRLGKNSHKLELGLGQDITITTKDRFFALTTAAIGYRQQKTGFTA
jgi:hypothetical protein